MTQSMGKGIDNMKDDDDTQCYRSELEAAVKAEREACALVCINIANKPSNVILGVAIDCAAAIRARGTE